MTTTFAIGTFALAPTLDFIVSDVNRQEALYIENYFSTFNAVGKAKDINPVMLMAIVKVEGGVQEGELVNPFNGQGIGQLYSWVVVTKQYYFPPGPLNSVEASEQIGIVADFVSQKCSDLNIHYNDMSDVDSLWDRVACFERYNGIRGGVRGRMETYPAVFNNMPGYPELQGMLIPDGDLSSNLVPMNQDGYEVVYQKFIKYLIGSEKEK